MVLFNYATKELTAKIVYYGPGLCGKTTNLQYIHQNLSDSVKGKMLSLATKTDRTLFFDFLPLDLGEIRGMKTRVQLYTVPGQVFYNETRKLVLKGVDGVVFVADSQQEMIAPNAESFKNLEENLKTHGTSLAELPHVIQFNKRDLPKLASIEDLNTALNKYNAPFYESVATTGIGVKDTLNAITKLVLLNLTQRYGASASKGESRPTPDGAKPVSSWQPVAVQPTTVVAEQPRRVAAPAGPAVTAPPARPRAATGPVLPTAPEAAFFEEPEVPRFGEHEIEDLVSEVQAERPDLLVDPPVTPASVGAEPRRAAAGPADGERQGPTSSRERVAELTLVEVASDHDLFTDPDIEVARLAAGQTREIIIPVEVGDRSNGSRRYKLSLMLRLDELD